MFSQIDAIVSNSLSLVTTLTAGSTGTVIYSVLGVGFLILLITLVYSIVNAVKKFKWSKR